MSNVHQQMLELVEALELLDLLRTPCPISISWIVFEGFFVAAKEAFIVHNPLGGSRDELEKHTVFPIIRDSVISALADER
jgi:hypothetical protein